MAGENSAVHALDPVHLRIKGRLLKSSTRLASSIRVSRRPLPELLRKFRPLHSCRMKAPLRLRASRKREPGKPWRPKKPSLLFPAKKRTLLPIFAAPIKIHASTTPKPLKPIFVPGISQLPVSPLLLPPHLLALVYCSVQKPSAPSLQPLPGK